MYTLGTKKERKKFTSHISPLSNKRLTFSVFKKTQRNFISFQKQPSAHILQRNLPESYLQIIQKEQQ